MLAEASLELVDALAEISACGLYIAGGPAMGPGCCAGIVAGGRARSLELDVMQMISSGDCRLEGKQLVAQL